MGSYYVYEHTFSNGVRYIGKGKNKRAYIFIGRNAYWRSLLEKHGPPLVKIIYMCEVEEDAYELEEFLIQELKMSGVKLCNLTNGGEGGSSGIVPTEATRKKLSEKAKGKKHTEATKELLRIASGSRTHTECTINKMRISAASSKAVKHIATGNVYRSAAEASRATGVSVNIIRVDANNGRSKKEWEFA